MSDDIVYAVLLIVSVGSGPLIRYAGGPTLRKYMSTLIGICLITFACRVEALHPLIVSVGNCVLISLVGPK